MTEASHVRLPDGRRLGYREYGDPGGHPVLFFHGWIGSRLDFAPNDAIARELGIRVISVDRPGCGSSDFQPRRTMLDWPNDVSSLADTLGIERFGLCGHSFGGPYVAACADRLAARITSAAIVAGISPVTLPGATRGMAAPVRAMLWLGARAPALTRPFVTLMAGSFKRPDLLRRSVGSTLSEGERALLQEPRFAGFLEDLGEMVRLGTKGAYWDARVFLGNWGFDCSNIGVPVFLFYGRADRNVPVEMGEYYRDAIPGSRAVFYEGEGHFIMYSRASDILGSLVGDAG